MRTRDRNLVDVSTKQKLIADLVLTAGSMVPDVRASRGTSVTTAAAKQALQRQAYDSACRDDCDHHPRFVERLDGCRGLNKGVQYCCRVRIKSADVAGNDLGRCADELRSLQIPCLQAIPKLLVQAAPSGYIGWYR